MTTTIEDIGIAMQPVERLSRDLRAAAGLLSRAEARYLVDTYYALQEQRIRAHGVLRSAGEEPNTLVTYVARQYEVLENDARRALQGYAEGQEAGRWAMRIKGIGPVLAAGLLAHIDVTKTPTVGHIWRFAGLDPTVTWQSKDKAAALYAEAAGDTPEAKLRAVAASLGQRVETFIDFASADAKGNDRKITAETAKAAIARRPWNADLKTLCWKVGESFVKVQGYDDDVYGHVYVERRALEDARNARGEFAEQAAYSLANKRYRADTVARGEYEAGRLPAARLYLRAKRYAVKLYLAHLHHVMFEVEYGQPPPRPYVIEHLGHTHFIEPPLWPMAK